MLSLCKVCLGLRRQLRGSGCCCTKQENLGLNSWNRVKPCKVVVVCNRTVLRSQEQRLSRCCGSASLASAAANRRCYSKQGVWWEHLRLASDLHTCTLVHAYSLPSTPRLINACILSNKLKCISYTTASCIININITSHVGVVLTTIRPQLRRLHLGSKLQDQGSHFLCYRTFPVSFTLGLRRWVSKQHQ